MSLFPDEYCVWQPESRLWYRRFPYDLAAKYFSQGCYVLLLAAEEIREDNTIAIPTGRRLRMRRYYYTNGDDSDAIECTDEITKLRQQLADAKKAVDTAERYFDELSRSGFGTALASAHRQSHHLLCKIYSTLKNWSNAVVFETEPPTPNDKCPMPNA